MWDESVDGRREEEGFQEPPLTVFYVPCNSSGLPGMEHLRLNDHLFVCDSRNAPKNAIHTILIIIIIIINNHSFFPDVAFTVMFDCQPTPA